MNKSKLENLERKPIMLNRSKKEGVSLQDKNPKTEPEKTRELNYENVGDDLYGDGSGSGYQPGTGPSDWEREIEDAEVLKSDPAEQMDEIIKSNDKFETIKVLMDILCKELGIPVESSLPDIGKALHRVTEDYYKAIDTWRAISKKPAKIDIRQ